MTSRTVEDFINYEEGLDESVIDYFGHAPKF